MIIAQLTDTHIVSSTAEAPSVAKLRVSDLNRCLLDIKSLPTRPDAIIHTGDIAHTANEKEYSTVLEMLKKLKIPFFVIPGNRDSRTSIRQIFLHRTYLLGGENDPIIYGINNFKVRLIGADSTSPGTNKGYFCPERILILDKMLSAFPNKPTAIFMHHPPIPIKTDETNRIEFTSREAGNKFVSMVSKHDHVVRVFCGHSHRPYIKKIGQTEFSTVPSIASDLRLGNYPKRMQGIPVYQIHEFNSSSNFVSHTRIVL